MDGQEKRDEDLQRRVSEALDNRELPSIYFNGFINYLGSGDVTLVLQRNGNPVAVIHTSHTVAKTLAIKLMDLIASLEADTNNTILTTDDINEAIRKKQQVASGEADDGYSQ